MEGAVWTVLRDRLRYGTWTMDSTSHYKDDKMDRYGPFCLIGCVMGRRTRHSTSQYKDAKISLGDYAHLIHAPIYPSPCMLCTPHACTHLPKPVHAAHVICMHPFTQARACCARHMHAPIYPSPCMLCTPHACTHLPKPVHAVHVTAASHIAQLTSQ